MNNKTKKIAIIGGGASGMIAGITAARNGHSVTIFEKQKCLGRKLSATGNGQCNISNSSISTDNYHGHNKNVLHSIFAAFSLEDTIDFFSSIGIRIVEKKDGKFYPMSLQAQSVTDALIFELNNLNVDIKLHRCVETVHKNGDVFYLQTAGMEKFSFDSVILSSGGSTYSKLGGSTKGYIIAESLGHKIYPPFPSIVPVNIIYKKLHTLEGIKWDCTLTVYSGDNRLCSSSGEVLFTKYGISGPASLNISRSVNDPVNRKRKPIIEIDFFPDMDFSDLKGLVNSIFIPGKTISFALCGIIKKRIPDVVCRCSGIDPETLCDNLSEHEKNAVCKTLKSMPVEPGEPRSMEEAVVAAGGVDVNEINPKTMESKKTKELYLTGEILDIDGNSGGFNLQFAWSTGAIAGTAVSKT